jgi:hypothetical protein
LVHIADLPLRSCIAWTTNGFNQSSHSEIILLKNEAGNPYGRPKWGGFGGLTLPLKFCLFCDPRKHILDWNDIFWSKISIGCKFGLGCRWAAKKVATQRKTNTLNRYISPIHGEARSQSILISFLHCRSLGQQNPLCQVSFFISWRVSVLLVPKV